MIGVTLRAFEFSHPTKAIRLTQSIIQMFRHSPGLLVQKTGAIKARSGSMNMRHHEENICFTPLVADAPIPRERLIVGGESLIVQVSQALRIAYSKERIRLQPYVLYLGRK